MARENIRFEEGNFTSDDTYFYTMLDSAQVLQQKVDDGTVAFSYPLDTAIAGNVKGLEWDGIYFWSMEDRAGNDGVTIRKWGIESFICKQMAKFEYINDATHTYDCDGLAIEHYRLTVGTNQNGDDYTVGLNAIQISDTSMLDPGDVLTFVKRYTPTAQRINTPYVEEKVVQSVTNSTLVLLTTVMSKTPHGASGAPTDPRGFRGPLVNPQTAVNGPHPPTPDEVFVTKFIWMSNDNSPGIPGTPSLYKARASNGTNVLQYSGTQYTNVNALTFYSKYTTDIGLDSLNTVYRKKVLHDNDRGGRQTYLLVARDSVLLFFNTTTTAIDRSMIMNNIKVDTVSHWDVFDMFVGGIEPDIVLYRLQQGTTYKNPSLVLTDASWGTYNYEKQLIRRVVSSIAVSLNPSIIPTDTDAVVTATLRDQYNEVAEGINTVFTHDGDGALDNTGAVQSDTFGHARNRYHAGSTEQDVKVVAAVTNGLL